MATRKKYTKESRYVFKFTVEISTTLSSVLDMMRYDSCYPASEEDAYKLARLRTPNAKPDDRFVTFIRAGRNANGPTEARWASRGCRVVEVHRP